MDFTTKSIKLAISLLIVSGAAYIFMSTPDWNLHICARRELLEDRAEDNKQKANALTELHYCYKSAEDMYVSNWARACRWDTVHKLNECVAANIPVNICNAKIIYNAGCELPTYQADKAQKYKDDAKSECRLMFGYATFSYNPTLK